MNTLNLIIQGHVKTLFDLISFLVITQAAIAFIFLAMILLFCFLATITLKRSKSERLALFLLFAIFLAHDDASHFERISSFSQAAVRVFDLGLKLILTVRSVREIRLKGMTCLFTPVILSGPSIRHLLLSTISIIVASFPVSGP